MGLRTRTERSPRVLRWGAVVAVLALVAGACGDDDDDTSGDTAPTETTAGGTGTTGVTETTSGGTATTGPSGGDEIPTGPGLGEPNPASGDAVKVGYFNDGVTPSVDHGDDTIVAEALTDYWNEYQGGIAGRPIELVYCSTDSDPAIATDCGNRFVEEDVIFVTSGTSGFNGQVFAPVHAAGIPFFNSAVSLPEVIGDPELSFVLVNGGAQTFGFPVAVAVREGIDSIVTIVIDVPAAVEPVEPNLGPAADAAGIEHSQVNITPGTPDMIPQLTAALQDDPGMIHIIGDPAFCLVALRGLYELDYAGTIVTADYCTEPATFEPLPSDKLADLVIAATVAMGPGAEDDPDWQLYEAIMDEFASEIPEVSGVRGWTYQSLFVPYWLLRGIDPANITPQAVADAAQSAPEAHLPLGGGLTFKCDGSKFPPGPAYCTNSTLEAHMDETRNLVDFEAVDVSAQMNAIAASMGG